MLVARLEIRIKDAEDRDLDLSREEQVEIFLDGLRDVVHEDVEKRKPMLPNGYEVEIEIT